MRRITLMGGIGMWPEGFVGPSDLEPLVSAPDARAYFLSRGRKKVAKERATPGSAPRYAGFLALLGGRGGCGTRAFGPQTVLALFPHPPALLSASQGEGKAPSEPTSPVNPKNSRKPRGLNPRLGDAEQRRLAGGSRLASVRAAGEFSQPPGLPSSAGNPAQRGFDSAVACSLATFFWRSKRKYARRQGGTPRLKHLPAVNSKTSNQ